MTTIFIYDSVRLNVILLLQSNIQVRLLACSSAFENDNVLKLLYYNYFKVWTHAANKTKKK